MYFEDIELLWVAQDGVRTFVLFAFVVLTAFQVVRQTTCSISKWSTPREIYVARTENELSHYLMKNRSVRDARARSRLVNDGPGDVSDTVRRLIVTSMSPTDAAFQSSTPVPSFPMSTEMIRFESCPATANDLVALRTGEHVFKIRRDILCQTSALFSDVLAIPQPLDPQSEDVYEGCALISVQETAEDVALFLKVCQDGGCVKLLS